MSTRYLTNLTLLILGAFVVVVSQAFLASTFMWLMFGAGIAAIAIAAPGLAVRSRGFTQRGLDSLTSILGAWTIVAAVVFSGATVTWLGFASGLALVALATIGLTLHELKTERVVHSITVETQTDYNQLAGAR
jgi:hypothetical protein